MVSQYLLVLSFALLFFSLAPYVQTSNIIIDLTSHFPLQYIICAAVLATASAYLKASPWVYCILSVVVVASFLQLKPFIPTQNGGGAGGIKILQANVLLDNKDATRLSRLIDQENPDIIFIYELHSVFKKMLEQKADEYPHQHLVSDDNFTRGIGVVSRLPLKDVKTLHLASPYTPAQQMTLVTDEGDVDILSIHPFTPITDMALRDQELAMVAERMRGRTRAVILGDFNATPYCYAYKKNFADFRNAREGRMIGGSFSAYLPAFSRIPIDHFLHGQGITVREHRLASAIGSDHLPVVTIFGIEKQR